MAPGFDHVLDEKRYKGRLSLGYNDDIVESRYAGRISLPSHRSPSEYQHTDSGYPSTSPVSSQRTPCNGHLVAISQALGLTVLFVIKMIIIYLVSMNLGMPRLKS